MAVVGLVLEKMGLAVLQPVVHVPPPPPVVAQEMTVGQLMGPVMVDVMVTWPSEDKQINRMLWLGRDGTHHSI